MVKIYIISNIHISFSMDIYKDSKKMSYCLFPIFRIFVRAVFTKNMYMNSQKHVRVFWETRTSF